MKQMKNEEFIPTGFDKLDQKIGGGFYAGELIVVAGRPLMGKTTFVLTMAQSMCNEQNLNIAYFSLEMECEQVWDRVGLINNMPKVKGNRTSFLVDDTPGISVEQLKQKCIERQKEQNIDIVFIDYLQLMRGDDKCASRIQELNYVANGLKELAIKLNIPIVLVVLQGRPVAQKRDFRPILSDLRESGSIAQIADTIIMLYRDDFYNQNSEKEGILKVYIEKQKHGEIGIVELGWSSDGPKVV